MRGLIGTALTGLLLTVPLLAHAGKTGPTGVGKRLTHNPQGYVKKHLGRWLREGAPWKRAKPLPRQISAAALRRYGHWAIYTSKDKTYSQVYSFNPNTKARDFDGSFHMEVRLASQKPSAAGQRKAFFRISGGGYEGVMRYREGGDGVTHMRMSRRIRIAGTHKSYEQEAGEIKYDARTGQTWIRDRGWDKIELRQGNKELGWFKGPRMYTGLKGAKKLTVMNWVLQGKRPPETASTYLRNLTLLF